MVAQAPSVTVTFHPDGKVTLDAHGFQGHACAAWIETIEQALPGAGRQVRLKPEFYLNANTAALHVRQGSASPGDEESPW